MGSAVVARASVCFLICSAVAAPAFSCTVRAVTTASQLVQQARVILRVRAETISISPRHTTPPDNEVPAPIRFTVLEVLKGAYSGPTIQVDGYFTEWDDRNEGTVPYTFVRPDGRHGNCFARQYRRGAEYLLILNVAPSAAALTPYWAPLAPVNEQVVGEADAWVAWVRRAVKEL